jgi:hypothetical protein
MPVVDERLLAAYDEILVAYHRYDAIGHEAFVSKRAILGRVDEPAEKGFPGGGEA